MNQISYEDQIRHVFNKYELLKRTLQLVFSVSVFSFFLWYSSGYSILPQSFNAYFSTCLFSMFTRTLERKYMFLICNGILAFLAKTSLITSSPPTSPFDLEIEFQASNSNLSQTEDPVSEEAVEEELEQVEKQEEYHERVSEAEEETEGRQNEASIAKGEEELERKDEEGGTGSEVMMTLDDESADTTMATNEELASTEELNRKFEEFIRKMKAEIRIEAQRQPIIAA